MKAVRMYVTRDGTTYPDERRARQHAESTYSNAVCSVAARLAALDKYQDVKTFIDESLDELCLLKVLKADCKLEASDFDLEEDAE